MVKTGFSSNLSNARNVDSVPGGGPKILDAVQKKKKKYAEECHDQCIHLNKSEI